MIPSIFTQSQLEDLYCQSGITILRDGVQNQKLRVNEMTRGVERNGQALKRVIQRLGLGLMPQSDVGTNAPLVVDRYKKKIVSTFRYASSYAFDQEALERDPLGYTKNMAEIHNISATATMNFIAEMTFVQGLTTIKSGVDDLPIYSTSHDAGDGQTQTNRFTGSIYQASGQNVILDALSALGSQLNTESLPVTNGTDTLEFKALVNAKKFAQAQVIFKSMGLVGTNFNDEVGTVISDSIKQVIPMQYLQLAGTGADNYVFLTPVQQESNPAYLFETVPIKMHVTPEIRDGLRYSVIQFKVAGDILTHYGTAIMGAA